MHDSEVAVGRRLPRLPHQARPFRRSRGFRVWPAQPGVTGPIPQGHPGAARRQPGALVLLGLVAAGALVLSGCGEDGQAASEQSTPSASSSANPAVAPPAGPRPTIAAREGEPPAELRITDIAEGYGPELATGDLVRVQYVGGLWPDGTEFDASWNRGQPFSFVLGAGQVIQGWDEGVVGMKLGGRRELVIPPELAYGESGSGPIPPNATLIFVVDAVGQVAASPSEDAE